MNRDEYEARKRRLEEELRCGMELLALYRLLTDLVREGELKIEARGEGRRATKYRRT